MARQLTLREWGPLGGGGVSTVLYIADDSIPELVLTLEGSPGVTVINLAQLFEKGKLVVDAGAGITSNPPVSGKEVKNIFVTPEGTLQVDYEDGT